MFTAFQYTISYTSFKGLLSITTKQNSRSCHIAVEDSINKIPRAKITYSSKMYSEL
jgi:hypothetical protein